MSLASRASKNSATAFSGFGDDEAGFYQTYERAFREVWDSERDWGEVSSSDNRDGTVWGQGEAPPMGRSKDSYETADSFYGSWSGFVSGLSFGWVDEYNVNEVSMPLYVLPCMHLFSVYFGTEVDISKGMHATIFCLVWCR